MEMLCVKCWIHMNLLLFLKHISVLSQCQGRKTSAMTLRKQLLLPIHLILLELVIVETERHK